MSNATQRGTRRPPHPSDRALRVGLTGGIGTGKSTVADLLAGHGATVVAADDIARDVVKPGTPGLAAVVEEFGQGVLKADGTLDRSALGSIVFADEGSRARLEEVLLPLIAAEAWARLEEVPAGEVAVYDVPLLVEGQMQDMFDLVVVVEADLEVRLSRLSRRGLGAEQAMARIASQATDAERRSVADVVLVNSGTPQALARDVASLWQEQLAPDRLS